MSLLMDALKKAELAKRHGQTHGEEISDAARVEEPPLLALEPLPTDLASPEVAPPTAKSALPELPSALEILDAEFMDHMRRPITAKPSALHRAPTPEIPIATERSAPPPIAISATVMPEANKRAPTTDVAIDTAAATEKNTAKNLFDAKQPAPGKNKAFIITIGVATLIAAIGIGIYFWMQLTPAGGLMPSTKSPPPLLPRAAPEALPVTPPPVTQPATETPPVAPVTAIATAAPVTARATPPLPPATNTLAVATPRTVVPESPIRITRAPFTVNPALVQAYDALNAGNSVLAQTAYTQVLKTEPKNPDALHGLAAVAVKQGQFDRAEEYYLRAIEADPKDAIAQAGMFGLRGQVDPINSESRLKTLIAAQPDQHFLQFALGNIHAGAARWTEAQQAFFKAYTGDPDHPDYIFNLAISLDHLRQSKLAAQYYNQALAAAEKRPANFDKAQAAMRLRELQP